MEELACLDLDSFIKHLTPYVRAEVIAFYSDAMRFAAYDVEDIVQEVLLKVPKFLSKFNPALIPKNCLSNKYLMGYMLGCIRNLLMLKSRSFRRKWKREDGAKWMYDSDFCDGIDEIPAPDFSAHRHSLDDIEIVQPISHKGMILLRILVEPSEELCEQYDEKIRKGGPHRRNFNNILFKWMGVSWHEFERLKEEIRVKCIL